MDQKGAVLLPQIVALSLLLIAAGSIFAAFQIYTRVRLNDDAELTAVFLAQKEISLVEGQILSGEKSYSSGIINEESLQKNGVLFQIKTTFSVYGKLKTVSTVVSWQISQKPGSFSLEKMIYDE